MGGTEFDVEAGKACLVGRGKPARFMVPDDEAMADVHFSLEHIGDTCRLRNMGDEGDTCRLRNMGDEGDTLLNGRPVQEAELRPGDEITAGQTVFVLALDTGKKDGPGEQPKADDEPTGHATVPAMPKAGSWGVPATPAAASPGGQAEDAHDPVTKPATVPAMPRAGSWGAEGAAPAKATEPQRVQRPAEEALDCAAKPCPCGLLHVIPLEEGLRPSAIIRQMAEVSPLYVIANLGQLKRPVPEDLERPDFLLYRMPDELLPQLSPVIIRDGDTADFDAILEQGWDKNSLVCLCSSCDRNELVGHLRKVVYCTPANPEDDDSGGVLGYYWPRIMSSLLDHGLEDFVGPLIDSISAFILETDKPGGWQLYASREYSEQLDELQVLRVNVTEESEAEDEA